MLQQASSTAQTTPAGASVWNSDINARFRWTNSGFRRVLLLRAGSDTATLASVADALCRRAGLEPTDFDVTALTQPVAGFVLARPILAREALQPLASAHLFDAVESNDVLRFRPRGGAPVATLVHGDLVRQGNVGRHQQRAQDADLPRALAPCQIAGTRDGSQNLAITWVRRARLGGELLDGTGTVPLGEASEAYQLEIRNAGDTTTLRTLTSATPSLVYTAAQQVADFGAVQVSVTVTIAQISAAVGRGISARATL